MLVVTEAIGRIPRAARASALICSAAAAFTICSVATPASPAPMVSRGETIAAAVDEASARFGIPTAWIYAIMHQESGGQESAVSAKGAMGLLQLMPATWRDLTTEFGLGDDPFEPRANILAGAIYMRRMYDRFGAPGFLAAYNAGPERYARSLVQGRALPRETQDYVRKLTPLIEGSRAERTLVSPARDWRTAGVFVVRGTNGVMADGPQVPGAPWTAVRP
ncbi:MAG: lytic transglycosylase domain-containing protein [Caulobacter sp.]|nr:lytic transglycosylase domain-containing protein [Caulobacter sp.]